MHWLRAGGPQRDFERFVTDSTGRLLRSAYLMTSDLAEAEDLVQETLLRVARRWPRVRAMEHPAAYARRILVNLVIDGAGTRVLVTMSGSTLVVVDSASPSELQTGANTIVVGYAEPDGTLPAIAIAHFPAAAQRTLAVSGCSPTSIDNAITTALLAG
jgi:predicted RNA polymerase sigma factor